MQYESASCAMWTMQELSASGYQKRDGYKAHKGA